VAVMEHNNNDDEEEEAVQKAAALLLRASGVSEFLFTELCSSCASLVQLRLRDLASGTNLQFLKGKNCEHSDENGVCTTGNSVVNGDKELHSLNNNTAALKTHVGVNGAHVQRITLENYNPTDKHGKSAVANRISELTARNAAQAVSESDVPQGSEDSGSVEEGVTTPSRQLSVAEREQRRLLGLKARKDFMCMERVDGRLLNVVEGLELHMGVFSAAEQTRLVNMVYDFQTKGRQQQLRERTYSEPRKWMRGKGRITIQFGCCYNYATDKYGNPPGILHEEAVDPLPQLLRNTIKRLVRWHVLPTTCVPDSCIINIYDEGDCIPPHIDHHDFVRPFCTLSLLSECCILFGGNLKIIGPGLFDGPVSIPLPVGSVLVLKGNGADVAKHAVPAVPTRRISITFRKMDPLKVPLGFVEDKELQGVCPAVLPSPQPGKENC